MESEGDRDREKRERMREGRQQLKVPIGVLSFEPV